MSTIAKDDRQLTLYYHSESSLGKQALAYLNASDRDINPIDISKTKVTGTQWVDIAKNLNMPLSELIDQDHPDFESNYDSPNNLSTDDWIKVIQNSPIALRYPILINGQKYNIIETPSEISKLLEIEDVSQDARSRGDS